MLWCNYIRIIAFFVIIVLNIDKEKRRFKTEFSSIFYCMSRLQSITKSITLTLPSLFTSVVHSSEAPSRYLCREMRSAIFISESLFASPGICAFVETRTSFSFHSIPQFESITDSTSGGPREIISVEQLEIVAVIPPETLYTISRSVLCEKVNVAYSLRGIVLVNTAKLSDNYRNVVVNKICFEFLIMLETAS